MKPTNPVFDDITTKLAAQEWQAPRVIRLNVGRATEAGSEPNPFKGEDSFYKVKS